jgi:cell division protein FtsI/penicillin-binding protein 2
MEAYPTFNPNNIDKNTPVSAFSNPLIENVYEMGSVIKPLTLAAGIDAGVVSATSTYNDLGFITVNNRRISNFDGKARGVVTMQEVISHSLNTGVAHIVELLGNKQFSAYMYRFGLNEKTGIDLPNEGKNLVKNLESPRDIEHVTASFGQGIALTPISTAAALATLANEGKRVYPHVVKHIQYKMGVTKETSVPVGEQVIRPETAHEVSRMLTYSTDHTLANGTLALQNYNVAVKTGTAQIPKKGGGGYSEDQFLHSFIGYFPSYKPRFFIFLYTVEPVGARYGSETLAEPFMNMVQFLINYYEVPPDR